VFHLGVAYVSIAIYSCCKRMFHVASVYFKCFRSILQMFYLNVSNIDLGVAHIAIVIHACFKCFNYFRLMLQMLHLDVFKVDLMLHMLVWLYTHVFKRMFHLF